MKKRISLIIGLVMLCTVLTACTQKETQKYQVVSAPNQGTSQTVQSQPQTQTQQEQSAPVQQSASAPATEPDYDAGEYDPTSEEGILDELLEPDGSGTLTTEPTPVPTMNSAYAGATPVILDPIDKPTPTPAPPITFASYATYDATNVGVSFQAPEGWTEEVGNGSYTIVNPDERMDYAGRLTVSMAAVTTDYTRAELAKEVKDILSDLRKQYNNFSPTNTAERTLMDKNGVYADFTAELKDSGTKIGGRVHAVCVSKRLYVMTMTWPRDYTETYKDTVYKNFRHSIQLTK